MCKSKSMVGGKQSFVLLVALVILPTVFINSMAALSYVSATGVLASVVILGSVLWAGMFDGVGFHHKGDLVNWSGLPTAFSLYAFYYCSHPVFPTLYTSMRNQRRTNISINYLYERQKLTYFMFSCRFCSFYRPKRVSNRFWADATFFFFYFPNFVLLSFKTSCTLVVERRTKN